MLIAGMFKCDVVTPVVAIPCCSDPEFCGVIQAIFENDRFFGRVHRPFSMESMRALLSLHQLIHTYIGFRLMNHSINPDCLRRRIFHCVLATVLVCFAGCSARVESTSGEGNLSQIANGANGTGHDNGLTESSTPTEVAKVALQAINSNDMAALLELVALKKVQQDVLAITQGRSNFQKMVDKAGVTAAQAINFEINNLDAQPREIGAETITGELATVIIEGMRAGKPQNRTLWFVREQGRWKLVPSRR